MKSLRVTLVTFMLSVLASTAMAASNSDDRMVDDGLGELKLVAGGKKTEETAKTNASSEAEAILSPELGKSALEKTPEVPAVEVAKVAPAQTKPASEAETPLSGIEKKDGRTPVSPWSRLMLSLLVLTAVFGVSILLVRRYMKRSNPLQASAKIRVLTQHHLGPKKSLLIAQVAGESFLLGVTDQNITLLKNLSLLEEEIPEEVPKTFSHAFKSMLGSEPKTIRQEERKALPPVEGEDTEDMFALSELAKIRDVVSTKVNGMRRF